MKKLFYNQILDKKGTKKILSWFLENYGPTRTSQFIEQLKSIGFHFATEAGLSLGFDDLKIPDKKLVVLNTAESDVSDCEKRYFQGKITAVERYQKFIDIWTTASENLKDEVIQNFQDTDLLNPLYMMAFSGARGNISQVRQLVGMRGLMSDSAGGIIDFPIRSNFREGLTVTEYAISCYGARKGLIDTALRTADSGYLTRRLVDVAHGIMIGRLECLTKESFEISPLKSASKSGSESILLSLEKRIVGRVLAENILTAGSMGAEHYVPQTMPPNSLTSASSFVAKKNQEITPSLAQKIVQYKKETIQVRSPLTCLHFQNLREDICQLCYGWSLAHGRLVSIGEAVGILAAQSIGEPGTQLTMRTFHTGGIFSTDIDAKIFAPHNGIVSFSTKAKGRKVRTFHGQTAFFTFEPIQLKISSFSPWVEGGQSPPPPKSSAPWAVGVLPSPPEDGYANSSQFGSPVLEEAVPLATQHSFSIFQLPSQSLIFVYPGQIISKNILCAEVSQLMSAKGAPSSIQPMGNGRAEFSVSGSFLGEALSSTYSKDEHSNGEKLRSKGTSSPPSSPSTKMRGATGWGGGGGGGGGHEAPPVPPSSPRKAIPTAKFVRGGRDEIHAQDFISSEKLVANEVSTSSSFPSSDEERESDELNKPNSKKVLSEIEGQIYFHRLAQRRQITEFEKLSHVKGVGSLWVLAGKGVFAEGPFKAGDFISKLKKPTYYLNGQKRASKFLSSQNQSLGTDLASGAPLASSLLWSEYFLKKSKLPFFFHLNKTIQTTEIHYYRLENYIFALQPNKTIPVLDRDSFQDEFEDALNNAPRKDTQNFQADTIDKKQRKSWLEKQSSSSFPVSTIFTFQHEKKNRLRISQKIFEKFNNRELIKFHLNNSDFFPSNKQLHPGYFYFKRKTPLLEYAFLKIFCLSTSGFFIEEDTKISILHSGFKTEQTRAVLLNKKSFIFIQNLKNAKIENLFVGMKKETKAQKILTTSKSQWQMSAQSSDFAKSYRLLPDQNCLSKFQFEHGELRFFHEVKAPSKTTVGSLLGGAGGRSPSGSVGVSIQGRRGSGDYVPRLLRPTLSQSDIHSRKNLGALGWKESQGQWEEGSVARHFPQSDSLSALSGELDSARDFDSPVSSFSPPSSNVSQFTGKSLNLRTADLRFYKISESFHKQVSSNGQVKLIPLRKIGELVRVGDEMEFQLGLDKTIQILRRTLNFNKEFFYTLRRVHPYLISNHSPLAVNHGDIVEARQYLFELFYQQSKTGDIVQGLPKIEQLFEARRTSLHVIETVHVKLKEKFQELCNQYPLYEAARLSIRFIQRILIDEIQLVYQSQGVDIADKHIEIIIRQMTSKVIIHEKGKGPFFPDDIIDFHQIGQFELEERKCEAMQKNLKQHKFGRDGSSLPCPPSSLSFENSIDPKILSSTAIVYEPIVLGLTKIAFLTQSFISAASFQETKRVLMNSALQSRVDFLYGLKENVIVGRFIRAGTGFRTSLFPSA